MSATSSPSKAPRGLAKRVRQIVGALIILLGFAIGGAYFLVQEYLNSEKFQTLLVSECKKRLHCQIKLDKASPSHAWKIYVKDQRLFVLGAVDLKGIHFLPRANGAKEWMYADSLRLRYHLYEAMVHQKILLEEIRLIKPQVNIDIPMGMRHSKNEIPLESIPKSKPTSNEDVPSLTEASSLTQSDLPTTVSLPSAEMMPWMEPPEVDLENFVFEGGNIQINSIKQVVLDDVNGKVSFSANPISSLAGSLDCKTIKLPEYIQFFDNRFTFLWRSDCIMIPSFSIGFLNGKIAGNFRADRTKGVPQYQSHLSVRDVSLEKAQAFWKKQEKGRFRGKMNAEISLHGQLIKSQRLAAEGTVRVEDARIMGFPILSIMSSYLRQPEFLELSLSECEFDFILDHPKLEIPRIKIKAKDLELSGKGSVNLLQGTRSFDLVLLVGPNLHTKFPQAIWEDLHQRPDERIELPIKIWGDGDHLQNDLEARFKPIVPRAVGGAIFDRIFQGLPEK